MDIARTWSKVPLGPRATRGARDFNLSAMPGNIVEPLVSAMDFRWIPPQRATTRSPGERTALPTGSTEGLALDHRRNSGSSLQKVANPARVGTSVAKAYFEAEILARIPLQGSCPRVSQPWPKTLPCSPLGFR